MGPCRLYLVAACRDLPNRFVSEMTKDSYRSVGAVLGLCFGMLLMFTLGLGGVLPGAVFGAGGAVVGAIFGEKLFAWRHVN